MGDFFKDRRRKTGLVTLAVACVLTVGWMRSYVIQDALLIPAQDGFSGIESHGGSLTWFRWSASQPELSFEWISQDAEFESDPWDQVDIAWRFELAGFRFGAATAKDSPASRLVLWILPYWSLVLPLTLLSAWLILIKPRKAKGSP